MTHLWRGSLLLVAAAFLLEGCFGSSWHSLRYFYTTIWDPVRDVSDFIAVAYVDDLLSGHYNSTVKRVVPQVSWIRKVEEDNPHFLDWYTKLAMLSDQRQKRYLKDQPHLYNQSREPPTVKVTHKASYDGLETLVCRAHGFHPKEIDVTWRKDGEIWEQETFRGGVVPNSDGTYHTWLSVKIDSKDRFRYQCHVDHDGLPEPLDVAWEEPVLSKVGLIAGVLVVVVAGLLVAGTIFYFWKRRGGYQAAHKAPSNL